MTILLNVFLLTSKLSFLLPFPSPFRHSVTFQRLIPSLYAIVQASLNQSCHMFALRGLGHTVSVRPDLPFI